MKNEMSTYIAVVLLLITLALSYMWLF